jgi:hypothetical protein
VVAAGWAGRGTAPAPQAQDSGWAAVEDQVAGPGAVAVVRLEAGRLAVPVCGNPVVRGAAELAAEQVQVAEPAVVAPEGLEPAAERREERARVAEAVLVGPAVAPEGLEPAAERREERAQVADPEQAAVAEEEPELVAERRGELKAPGLENGLPPRPCCEAARPRELPVYRELARAREQAADSASKRKMFVRCWDCSRNWANRGKILNTAWTCRRSNRA